MRCFSFNVSKHIALGLAAIGALISILIALMFAYWLGHGSGYKEAKVQHYQTEYENHTDDRIKHCERKSDPDHLSECIEEAIVANHEQQRSEGNLNVQRQMSDWAFWALVVSTVSAVTTAIGTAFLLWQIILTRKAVADTSEATEAMREANEITRRTADAQLRPYLGIEQVLPKSPENRTQSIEVKLKNFGSTPAQNIKQEWGVAYVPLGMDSWPVISGVVELGREIAPGHFQRAILELDDWATEMANVIAGKGAIRIILRVAYEGLGEVRPPLIAKIIFHKGGASVATESVSGVFAN